jgi:hypothetical protein
MYLVACGATGFGDWICDTDRGRPFGTSAARLSRRDSRRDFFSDEEDLDDEDLCLSDEDLELDLEPDFSTSRMFRTRPVVGSVVEACPGSWETWYPSMI